MTDVRSADLGLTRHRHHHAIDFPTPIAAHVDSLAATDRDDSIHR
ncbi:hypothetical protein ACKVMT_08615 [Halobacteriales archaeon Cl-PHB]